MQEKQLLSAIFGIEEILVLNNLLAVFYIDQEKGWTMLNIGKIIGNIRFNIEEYIAGLSGKDICSYEVTKDNLINYNNNQELLELKRKNLKIELEEINIELKKIEKEIIEKNILFFLEYILDNLENQIADMNIYINSVDKIINQLNNKRKKINQKIKDELSFNNQQLVEFYDIINKYAIELGIKQYIKNDTPSFVLTSKLKGFSGRILAQMAYIFKLAYLKSIDNKYGIKLPIIIDSPRTNELSESSTDDMMKILKRDFSEHQIILASIDKTDILECNIVDLNNGLIRN